MPAVVLRDSQAKEVGFLLAEGSDPITTLGSREVVLMSWPVPSSSTIEDFVRDHKHVEFIANVASSVDGYTLDFEISDQHPFLMRFNNSGDGSWSIEGIGAGSCKVLD